MLLAPFAGRAVLNAGAVTFHGVVDDCLYRAERVLGAASATRWRNGAVAAYDRIGATWWRAHLDPDPAGATPRWSTPEIDLHPDGAGRWVVGPSGTAAVLPDWRGLHYLRELLRRPGVEVDAAELAGAQQGHGTVITSNMDDLIDRDALAAYRRRLGEIDAELDEAMSWTDEGRLDRLHAEKEALLDQVRTATGLGGRRRRFGSTDEKARVAVRKAIAATLHRLSTVDPALARLLRDTVRTGARCVYEPDPARPVRWMLDDLSTR
jgi:hypothetical protein